MDVSWEEAKSVAGDCEEWTSLVAQCSGGNRRTYTYGKSKQVKLQFINFQP